MRQGSYDDLAAIFVNLRSARQIVKTVNVHSTRATDCGSTHGPEGQGWVNILKDMDQPFQNGHSFGAFKSEGLKIRLLVLIRIVS
jgi:hypothetical protein